MMKKILTTTLLALGLAGVAVASDFVRVRGTQLLRGDSPYYFIGTNFWYGPILGSEGRGGDRDRLLRELDSLKACGIDNLRILVGADGGSAEANSVTPCLQPEPGVLNDTLLAGLDYLLAEMGKRRMVGVLYLTNSWDWSGGYGFYLKHSGHGDSPNAEGEGYGRYVAYASDFFREERARQLFRDHVKRIVTRTNRYTGKAYKDDPAIMAWQLCNEPRPFAKDTKEAFFRWVTSTAQLIKSLDPNHLVSTGSEGLYGCETDEILCSRVHGSPNIDYLTVHVWPINWRWAGRDRLFESLPNVYVKSDAYLQTHIRMAEKMNKPMVIEEFGYARDLNAYEPGTPTLARDQFYEYVFSKVVQSRSERGPIAGCNFWGWGGEGRPDSVRWQPGQDYICDPPHEPQGWYSVFNTDTTTVGVVRKAVKQLQE